MNSAKLVRQNILNLAPYSSARAEYSGKEGIFLDANENPFGSYNRYPDSQQSALKQKIAELKNIPIQQIFLGNGSDEVIDLAFRIFCEPMRDKALCLVPTYGMYEVSAAINAVSLIKVPLNSEFQIDRAALKPFFSDENLKLLFICSPNNPTGNLLNKADIDFVLNNFKGIVVIDEAYIDFCDRPSYLTELTKYPNLIVCQTLSKAWGLAGIRLGMAFMHEELVAYFNKVKAPYSISTINQQVALAALKNEDDFLEKLSVLRREKEKLGLALQEVACIRKIYPSDANFFLVEVVDANRVYDRLVERKIIIRNRNRLVKNCLRISVGSPQENEQIIQALKEISHDEKGIIY